MPLYEYHCSECGQTFERLRRLSDQDNDPANPVRCACCDSPQVERIVYSRVAVQGTSCSPGGG